jgi:Mg-chelatase subunit ChlD
LVIGTRAALALYEMMQALTFLQVRQPILTAALITLPHRIRNDTLIDNEQIVREIVESLNNREPYHDVNNRGKNLLYQMIIKILRELDRLQDMIYAMPYEIDILDSRWFQVSQESLFMAEAPTITAFSSDRDKKADFGIYKSLLDNLQNMGLILIKGRSLKLTRLGSIVKYTEVFNYVKQNYSIFFKNKKHYMSDSTDDRRYQRGDRYKDLHIRRTMRRMIKKGKTNGHVVREVLRSKDRVVKRECILVLALDHSWSMARSGKLQSAKDAAAGLILAVRKNRDQAALISFSDRAVILSHLTTRYELLFEKISSLRPENATNIADALIKTRRIFLSSNNRNSIKYSIIITDGIPTMTGQDVTRKDLESKIIAEVRKMRKMGIIVGVICIRDELEENDTTLARKIASIGRGSFSLVNTQNLLEQILRDYSSVRLKGT